MRILLFTLFLTLFISNSYSQVESSSRKIDITPPKKSVKIPPVIKNNPNSFTFKKIEKSEDKKGFMIPDKEYYLNPGDTYLKRLNKEKEKNPNNYTGDAYLGDVKTISD
ncbi:MAG: hypothetical protein ISP60_01820, partial [Flavobacteriaceae bacterium]|nr:hypothetical protein [Flavobacteriaceae bacterium]